MSTASYAPQAGGHEMMRMAGALFLFRHRGVSISNRSTTCPVGRMAIPGTLRGNIIGAGSTKCIGISFGRPPDPISGRLDSCDITLSVFGHDFTAT